MNNNEIKKIILDFKSLIYEGCGSDIKNQKKLIKLVDGLGYATHFIKYKFDETEYPNMPDMDYDKLFNLVKQRFSKYGHYNHVFDITQNIGTGEISVGNAIGDIADIMFDLEKVIWKWENTSEADALWEFEILFKTHWYHHLRNLQVYLEEFRDH